MTRLTALIILVFGLITPAFAEDEHPRPYQAESDAMAEVDRALADAIASERRLLLVLGANWCHDSRALAHYFEDDTLSALLETHYVVRHVDVGWRHRNHDVMRRFGIAAIYATPTVLIIDPEDEFLLNRQSTEYWTSAASRPVSDAIEYFTRWVDAQSDVDGLIPASVIYQSMLTEIEVFEAEEGERLSAAYIDIAQWRDLPVHERPDNYRTLAREVEDWRQDMVRQVRRLRAQALELVETELAVMADGAPITLDLIDAFDQSDADLPLDMEPHQSDRW
ncbi:MAG: thioredoxin family protein [Alphaproteobacteria bacterium]|nr:thioredoxin family protein [Alphaproteobacteria bacterium]